MGQPKNVLEYLQNDSNIWRKCDFPFDVILPFKTFFIKENLKEIETMNFIVPIIQLKQPSTFFDLPYPFLIRIF